MTFEIPLRNAETFHIPSRGNPSVQAFVPRMLDPEHWAAITKLRAKNWAWEFGAFPIGRQPFNAPLIYNARENVFRDVRDVVARHLVWLARDAHARSLAENGDALVSRNWNDATRMQDLLETKSGRRLRLVYLDGQLFQKLHSHLNRRGMVASVPTMHMYRHPWTGIPNGLRAWMWCCAMCEADWNRAHALSLPPLPRDIGPSGRAAWRDMRKHTVNHKRHLLEEGISQPYNGIRSAVSASIETYMDASRLNSIKERLG